MPRRPTAIITLLLATALHVDWHLARPEHHRLSLGWSDHWIATALIFLIAGCVITRRWPEHRWRMSVVVLLAAAALAQLVEPMLEVLVYQGRLGYAGEPERWAAFWKAIGAGALALIVGLLCMRRSYSLRAG